MAAFTLGRLTAPEVEATESTATTEPSLSQPTTTVDPADFRVVDIQQGPQVRWARGFGLGDVWPIALLEYEGLFYLFGGSPFLGLGPFDAEMRVFVSDDGIFWTEREHELTTITVSSVITAGGTLTALGRDNSTGSPVIARSTDGTTWRTETLPLPRQLEPGETSFFFTAASRDRHTYAFGGIRLDPQRLIADYLPPEMTETTGGIMGGLEFGPASAIFRAPLGVKTIVATYEELGVPDDVVDRLAPQAASESIYVWNSQGSSGWAVSDFEALWVEQAQISGDGTVVATGFGASNAQAWTSSDGILWTETDLPLQSGPIVAWNEDLLIADHNGLGTADVSVSDVGTEWESLGVDNLLPDSLDWFIRPLAVGEAGVGFFAFGDQRTGAPGPARMVDAVLERDGYRLTYSFDGGNLTMDHLASGETIFTTDSFNPAVSAPASIDFSSGTVTFHDTDTQEPLVAFSLLELEAAEQEAFRQAYSADGLRAFLWSRDGLAWSVQDMSEIMPEGPVERLLITDDRMIAITVDSFFGGSTPPRVIPWLGLVPSR